MKVLATHVKQAEFHRTCWSVRPDAGTSLDDMLKSDNWVHVAKMLRVTDQVELMPADGAWYALLVVRSNLPAVGPKFGVLHHVAFDDATAAKPAAKASKPAEQKAPEVIGDFYAKFGGGDKWRVHRASDDEIVARGLGSKDEAHDWIKQQSAELV